MKTLNIRKLPEDVHARLRMRAAKHGRSMEAEARDIITDAVSQVETDRWLKDIRALVAQGFGKRKPKNVVDKFIAERRREAAREEAKWSSSTPRRSSR